MLIHRLWLAQGIFTRSRRNSWREMFGFVCPWGAIAPSLIDAAVGDASVRTPRCGSCASSAAFCCRWQFAEFGLEVRQIAFPRDGREAVCSLDRGLEGGAGFLRVAGSGCGFAECGFRKKVSRIKGDSLAGEHERLLRILPPQFAGVLGAAQRG